MSFFTFCYQNFVSFFYFSYAFYIFFSFTVSPLQYIIKYASKSRSSSLRNFLHLSVNSPPPTPQLNPISPLRLCSTMQSEAQFKLYATEQVAFCAPLRLMQPGRATEVFFLTSGLPRKWGQRVPPTRWRPSTKLHGVTCQKIEIFKFTLVRT